MRDSRLAIRHTTVIACLVFALATGCQQESSAPNAKRGIPEGPYAKVQIDDLLARTDFPEAARARFEALKKNGRKDIIGKEIDSIIEMTYVREPVE